MKEQMNEEEPFYPETDRELIAPGRPAAVNPPLKTQGLATAALTGFPLRVAASCAVRTDPNRQKSASAGKTSLRICPPSAGTRQP